jgi:hypothetical protein
MRLIAELQGVPDNDNGRVDCPEMEGTAELLESSASNDGRGADNTGVPTLVVFLPDEDHSECTSDEDRPTAPAAVALLPILRPANDEDPIEDADALLAADAEFDALCDERRERWIDAMDTCDEVLGSNIGADDDGPRSEGADDDECA